MTAQPTLRLAVSDSADDVQSNPDTGEAFAAFTEDSDTRDSVARAAAVRGWPASTVHEGGIAAAVRTFTVAPAPRVLVVDMSASADPTTDIRALMELVGSDRSVIALGTVNDVALYRELMAAGVREYLVKPVTADDLRRAIEKNETASPVPANEARSGRVTVVMGARGGVGASTVAVNSAWLMAHELDHRVVLVDFDFEFGTLALALDVEPYSGLHEALEVPERLDDLLIDRATVKKSESLYVLGAQAPLEAAVNCDPLALTTLLDHLRSRFDDVVVDLPRTTRERDVVLGEASEVVVVSEFSLAGVRDTVRLVDFCKQAAPKARVSVVVNRAEAGGKGQISKANFERALENRVDLVVPLDAKAAAKSVNVGEPMARIARTSKAIKALRQLGARLTGTDTAQGKSAWRKAKR